MLEDAEIESMVKVLEYILEEMKYTDIDQPTYTDKFHSVRQLIEEWNKNVQQTFILGRVSCIDELMSFWTNGYTCPGFMFVPRNPWPFGNEYHSICCE